jgi:hypothetical protein
MWLGAMWGSNAGARGEEEGDSSRRPRHWVLAAIQEGADTIVRSAISIFRVVPDQLGGRVQTKAWLRTLR